MAAKEQSDNTSEVPIFGDRGPTWPKTVGQLTDRFGNTFNFGNCGEFWSCAFPIGSDIDYKTHARNTRDFEIRESDILICAYPKTGYHWHDAIINMLINKSAQHGRTRGNFLDPGLKMAEAAPSPRILSSHFPFRWVPQQAFTKKIKIVHIVRNPKDVAVSLFNHLNNHVGLLHMPGTFEQFYHLFMEVGPYYGRYFDYLMDFQEGFESLPDVHVHTCVYEDMKADPVAGVMKLNEYLGTGCDPQLCADIAKACDFDALRKVKDEAMPEGIKRLFKKDAPTFYRKGAVGDWKNWFTVAMNEDFDEEYTRCMKDYKIQFKWEM